MANQSPEPKNNKDLLEYLYLKHGLNLKDNDTSIRGAKYDGLVTEYNARVNGNYDKKVLKKFFDNQKEISQIDCYIFAKSVNWEENREFASKSVN